MSKGKNFTAAEKHFNKKEQVFKNEIKYLKNENSKLNKQLISKLEECDSYKEELKDLHKKNQELENLITEFKKIIPLTEEELDIFIKKTKQDYDGCNSLQILQSMMYKLTI